MFFIVFTSYKLFTLICIILLDFAYIDRNNSVFFSYRCNNNKYIFGKDDVSNRKDKDPNVFANCVFF